MRANLNPSPNPYPSLALSLILNLTLKGVFNRRCLHLAALASKAVDYQKNGTAVTLPRELRATKVPHIITLPLPLTLTLL